MSRPVLEVADIFRDHDDAWREANRGHVSLGQLKVMSAIERCRTAALGGHVARCESDACGRTVVAFNSCRDRHCPKCQGPRHDCADGGSACEFRRGRITLAESPASAAIHQMSTFTAISMASSISIPR
jgi:hypothetical protein